MSSPALRLAEGLGWPEGPAVLPDATVLFVEAYCSRISAIEPHSRSPAVRTFSYTGGGPNAVAAGSDGGVYVTQNSGIVGPWRAADRRPASIQRIDPGGAVEILAAEIDGVELRAPNDLCFGRDGRLYFTDPGRHDPDSQPDPGYVFALASSGQGEVIAEMAPCYPNGIVAEAAGDIVWVESYTRLVKRWSPEAGTAVICELADGRLPDGLAIAENGDLYITTTATGAVDIVAPDGNEKGTIDIGGCTTNCAFAGSRLLVTDGGHRGDSPTPRLVGSLWSVEVGVDGQQLYGGTFA